MVDPVTIAPTGARVPSYPMPAPRVDGPLAIGADRPDRPKATIVENDTALTAAARHLEFTGRRLSEDIFQMVVNALRSAGQQDPPQLGVAECLFEDRQVAARDVLKL